MSDVRWPVADWRGTVRDVATYNAATNVTTIANRKVYEAFGKVFSEISATVVDTIFGYTGRFFDDDTGLQWNTDRWYDPGVGRWLSEDPIGFAAGDPNLYRYVGNSAGDRCWDTQSITRNACSAGSTGDVSMADIWDVVPERFRYLRKAVELCGETQIAPYDPVLKRHVSFTERVTKEQLDCLASVHGEILRKGDASGIYEWCRSVRHGSEEERGASWQIGGILGVLERLAEQDASPFCDAPLESEDPAPMDEDPALRLPEDLEYLVGPALHFGEQYCDELRMLGFFQEASASECDTLAALAERVRINGDWPRILGWLNEVGSRQVRYCLEIDNLIHLMDMCGFNFEPE